MMTHLLQQVLVLVAAALLLGVPGWALVTLLRVRAALPDALAVPAAAVFGGVLASACTAVQLVLHVRVWWPIALHLTVSVVLAVAAAAVARRRRTRGTADQPVGRGWDSWTSVFVVTAGLFTWVVRGAVRLDGMYHTALIRKLVMLRHPSFDNINRFVDGGPNPTYALPGWHALIGWSAQLARVDAIIAYEIMPVLVVVLGALASAGLARVLLDTPRAQPLGALAWVVMRVLMARREVDGDAILFGAVPGQVTFEIVFPVLMACIAVAMWTPSRRVLVASLATSFACIASIIIYHANYIPYVAILGLGYVAWWAVSGPTGPGVGRRVLVVGGWIAAMCVVCFGAVLPLLAGIDDFGQSDETRIDYHLTRTLGMQHIRGGHLYEMLGMPGFVAILVAPLVLWRWRGRRTNLLGGGLLALMTMCVIPPLFELMRHTGSLTLGLRINHVIGSLLAVVLAGFVLLAADEFDARHVSRGQRAVVIGVAMLLIVACGVLIGYTRFMPDWPGYLSWLGLLAVWLARVVARVRRRPRPVSSLDVAGDSAGCARAGVRAPLRAIAWTGALLCVALALPVGAISARRAVLNADPFGAGVAQGELQCLNGPVSKALQQLPAGSTLMSDPAASFRAMSLAPVYVVGDYKVWNGTNQESIRRRLADVNGFFDQSLSDRERIARLRQQHVEYLLLSTWDGRWLVPGEAEHDPWLGRLTSIQRRLDRFRDVQAYDGGGAARLVLRNPGVFRRIALDSRAYTTAVPKVHPGEGASNCNDYGLWKVDTTAPHGSYRYVFRAAYVNPRSGD